MLRNPIEFFENARKENWKPTFKFFLEITIFLSIITPIVNYFGIESTDYSSSYQGQILVYKILKNNLLAQFGNWSYLIEGLLIIGFGITFLLFITIFFHLIFKLMGGKGSILNAWKAMCYGVGPCVFGGFLPYISLFVAFYSLIIQFYIGPKVLYKINESIAIIFLAAMIALAFIEMFVFGTTVGFG